MKSLIILSSSLRFSLFIEEDFELSEGSIIEERLLFILESFNLLLARLLVLINELFKSPLDLQVL